MKKGCLAPRPRHLVIDEEPTKNIGGLVLRARRGSGSVHISPTLGVIVEVLGRTSKEQPRDGSSPSEAYERLLVASITFHQAAQNENLISVPIGCYYRRVLLASGFSII